VPGRLLWAGSTLTPQAPAAAEQPQPPAAAQQPNRVIEIKGNCNMMNWMNLIGYPALKISYLYTTKYNQSATKIDKWLMSHNI